MKREQQEEATDKEAEVQMRCGNRQDELMLSADPAHLCVTHTWQVRLRVCLQLQVSSGCVLITLLGEHVSSSTSRAIHHTRVSTATLLYYHTAWPDQSVNEQQEERRGKKAICKPVFCSINLENSSPAECVM